MIDHENAVSAEDVAKMADLAREELHDAHQQLIERNTVLENVLGRLVEGFGMMAHGDAVRELLRGKQVAVGPKELLHIIQCAGDEAYSNALHTPMDDREVAAVQEAIKDPREETPEERAERVIGAFLLARRQRMNL